MKGELEHLLSPDGSTPLELLDEQFILLDESCTFLGENIKLLDEESNVSHRLLANNIQLPINEHILFCEFPSYANGITSLFKLMVILCNIVAIFIGLFAVRETETLFCLFASIVVWPLLVWLFLVNFKWDFFAFRIVTNYRAMLIIPKRKLLICGPGIKSVYFQSKLEGLAKGEFEVKQKWFTICSNHLAMLTGEFPSDQNADQPSENPRNSEQLSGKAIIFGNDQVLHFGHVENIRLLEDVLVKVVENTSNEKMRKLMELRAEGELPLVIQEWTCRNIIYSIIWSLGLGVGVYIALFSTLPSVAYYIYCGDLIANVICLCLVIVASAHSLSRQGRPVFIAQFEEPA